MGVVSGFLCWGLCQFLGLGFGRVKQFVYAAKRTERAVKLSSFLSVAVQGKFNESLLSNCRVQPILCKDRKFSIKLYKKKRLLRKNYAKICRIT